MIFLLGLMAAAAPALFCSCEWIDSPDSGDGEIRLHFIDNDVIATRASAEIPDTNDFMLTIRNAEGGTLYEGAYGASPESLAASAGTYTVKVVSRRFTAPEFSAPVYGDEQLVVVPAGGKADVELTCRQMNCGIKLSVGPSFLTSYPKGVLFVQSDNSHKLMYAYTEKRIAYFDPGTVSVVLSDAGTTRTLLSRSLMSQEILSLAVIAGSGSDGSGSGSEGSPDDTGWGLSISVDTTRNWSSSSYIIGSGEVIDNAKGRSSDNAYTVAGAKENIGETGVWVSGYIVGGDMTSSASGMKTEGPFSSATNIAIAGRSSVTDKQSCLSVQLPSGAVREALNLVAHPENMGKRLLIKGDIVSAYYGIPGIKNPTEFILK
ncbi:MAG: DUF4493 domain-containing protein [Bacteroidales bacterium]|nr:DUF4493 domain-containing protein [Bacteroidales bacterium]